MFLYFSTIKYVISLFFKNFFKDFIYSTEIETASERGNTSRGSGRGRSRLIAEEPDVGLDPITPGSRPEPKADTSLNRCATQAPLIVILICIFLRIYDVEQLFILFTIYKSLVRCLLRSLVHFLTKLFN